MVHCGHAVSAPKSFEFAIADSCNDSFIASEFDVSIVPFDYFCLVIEGLSVVGGFEFVCSHDVISLSIIMFVGWWSPPLLTVFIVSQKRLLVK